MKVIQLSLKSSYRHFRSQRFSVNLQSNKDWILFPREQEGNIYAHNWSLVNDGLTPIHNAYRNARVDLLATNLPAKVADGKIEISSIAFSGSFALKEAGDSITQENFTTILQDCQAKLGSSPSIFVEDAAVIAHYGSRIGVRIITDNPGLAIVARSLLIPTPPAEVIPLARFDGWKYDKRYSHSDYSEISWTGSNYAISNQPLDGGKGQRPIVAYVGGPGSDVYTQYIELNGKIVGANIVFGTSSPVSAIISGIGEAASVVSNDLNPSAIALSSLSCVKNDKCIVVVNANEAVVQYAAKENILYGPYHNILTVDGVSAFWNGYIADAPKSAGKLPLVLNQGKGVQIASPDNMSHPAVVLAFFEEGKAKSAISAEDAVARVVKITDEKKLDFIKSLLKDTKSFVIGNPQEIVTLV